MSINRMSDFTFKWTDVPGNYMKTSAADTKNKLDMRDIQIRDYLISVIDVLNNEGASHLGAKDLNNISKSIQEILTYLLTGDKNKGDNLTVLNEFKVITEKLIEELNQKIEDFNSNILGTLKDEFIDLKNTFDNLIINAGESNAEIVAARYDNVGNTNYDMLGDRLDNITNELNEKVYYVEDYSNNIEIPMVDEKLEEINQKIDEVLNNYYMDSNSTATLNIGIDYPLFNLKKCDKTGLTDSILNLQSMHDYLVSHYEKSTLYIPNGIFRIENTFNWNTSKVQIVCDGEIHYYGDLIAIQTTSILQGNAPSLSLYKQGKMRNKGLTLIGQGKGIGLNIHENNTLFTGTNRMSFDDFTIHSFDTNLRTGNKAYLLTFNKLSTWNANTVCVHVDSGVDSGENITFNECALFNSNRLLKCSNEFTSIFLNSCSLDYASQNFIDIEKGHVWCKSCHFESKQEYFYEDNRENIPFILRSYDGNLLDINGGWIVFQQKSGETNLFPMSYIFRNDRKNYINKILVSNVLCQGFRCKTKTVCDSEDGLILFDKIHTYEWDRVVLSSSKFSSVSSDVNQNNLTEWGKRLTNGLDFITPFNANGHGTGKGTTDVTINSVGNGGYYIYIPTQDKTLLSATVVLSASANVTVILRALKYVEYQGTFLMTNVISEQSVTLNSTPQTFMLQDRQVQLGNSRGQIIFEIGLDGVPSGTVIKVGDRNINVC